MQIVSIPDKLHAETLLEKGIATMPGRRGIGPGPMCLKATNGQTLVMATSVEFKTVKDLDRKDAIDEGLAEAQMLKRYLKRFFENLDDTDILTIIRWNPKDEFRDEDS